MGYIDAGSELTSAQQPRVEIFPRQQTWQERTIATEAWLDEMCQTAETRQSVPDAALQEALKLTLFFLPPQVVPGVRRLLDLAEQDHSNDIRKNG